MRMYLLENNDKHVGGVVFLKNKKPYSLVFRGYRTAKGFFGLGISKSPGGIHIQIGPFVITTEEE